MGEDATSNVQKPAGELPKGIWHVVFEELQYALRIVYCAAYISWWRLKHYISLDEKLNKRAKFAAAISGIIFFTDIVFFFLHRELARWVGGAALFLFIPAGLLLFLHHFVEVFTDKKRESFEKQVEPLVCALAEIGRAAPNAKQDALDRFVADLLKMIYENFSERKLVSVNVMFPDTGGKLRILFLFPIGTKYDPNLSFSPGHGGAGLCYSEKKIIYIPATRYLHGIALGIPDAKVGDGHISYGLMRRLYVDIAPGFAVFNSIVCVPVESPSGKHGVLNLDCNTQDAFNIHDFRVLKTFGTVLGQGISMCP